VSLKSIFLTVIVVCSVWYWLRARELKDQTLRAAAQHCEELSLKLLDDSVVLKSIRPVRSKNGNISLKRYYQFDFTSTGEDRYQGEIHLVGRQVQQIKLQPHRVE